MNFDKEVDARGLNCPLPILRAKKMLAEMQSGQVVRVVATDPGSVKDFQAFARQTGNELVQQGETADKAFEFFAQTDKQGISGVEIAAQHLAGFLQDVLQLVG